MGDIFSKGCWNFLLFSLDMAMFKKKKGEIFSVIQTNSQK